MDDPAGPGNSESCSVFASGSVGHEETTDTSGTEKSLACVAFAENCAGRPGRYRGR